MTPDNPIRKATVSFLRTTGLFHPLRDFRRDLQFANRMRTAERRWRLQGRPPPPPPSRKHAVLRRFARKHGCKVLVETGTFYGDTPFAFRREFREIHSIELAPALHSLALREMGHLANIHFHLGDSARVLPEVAATLSGPTLYWLDGHFCSGPSARSDKDTPISEELRFLLNRPPSNDVVLIDDARLFDGSDGYPTIDELRKLLGRHRPAAEFGVEEDIITAAPV